MMKHKHHSKKHDDASPEGPDTPEAAGVEPAPEATEPVAPDAAGVEKKIAEDRYLRLMADFDNFRRRTLKERAEAGRMANEDFVRELLPVIDHLNLALEAAAGAGANAVTQGFRMVGEQLEGTLKKFGVMPIETAGQAFDPSLHEAITNLPSDTVAEGLVLKETRKGYLFGTRLLRAAQVIVSSGPEPSAPPAEPVVAVSEDEPLTEG